MIGDAQRLVQVLVNLLANAIVRAEGSIAAPRRAARPTRGGRAVGRGRGAGNAGGDEDAIWRASAALPATSRTRPASASACGSSSRSSSATAARCAPRTPLQRTRFTVSRSAESPDEDPVVDDDPTCSPSPASLQQAATGRRLPARSAFRARHLPRGNAPDGAILDINLPGGSGFELCAALRRESDLLIPDADRARRRRPTRRARSISAQTTTRPSCSARAR